MTPAHIRYPEGADHVQIVFLESARFYRLSKANPRFDQILARLQRAILEKLPVHVLCAPPHGDTIEDVRPFPPSPHDQNPPPE